MLINALENAWTKLETQDWDTIFWAVDLHGVVLASTYSQGSYQIINTQAIDVLKRISSVESQRLILWSSCHPNEIPVLIEWFENLGIKIDYFNENPEVANTHSGNFEKKFYFSILLDDKAGFDPKVDWKVISDFLDHKGI